MQTQRKTIGSYLLVSFTDPFFLSRFVEPSGNMKSPTVSGHSDKRIRLITMFEGVTRLFVHSWTQWEAFL